MLNKNTSRKFIAANPPQGFGRISLRLRRKGAKVQIPLFPPLLKGDERGIPNIVG
jgi:hypothetical protein